MNIYNLITVIKVFFGYSVPVFGFSAFFLRPVLKGKRFSVVFLACFLAGNFYVMNVTFSLLLFFHCANRSITILTLIFGALLIRFLLGFKKTGLHIQESWSKFQRLIAGTYGWRLFFKEKRQKLSGNLGKGILFILAEHPMEIIGVLICLAMQVYYTGYRLVYYSGYGGYDEVVHANWVQHMMNGEIYSAGVYPFGFHEMVYALAKIFGMNASQVVRNFGIVIMLYMTLMLYCLIADTLENRIAAFLATFLYAGVNIYTQVAWDRCGFGFPQEFGAVFLYPMLVFLYLYLKEKKKFFLFFFGMGFSLTLYVHYYITMIALLLCLSVGIVYFIYMFRKKLLIPILICGIAASAVGAMTMVLGVAAGHRLQGSLYWALGVIAGEEEEISEETLSGEDEDSETSETMGTYVVSQGSIVSSAAVSEIPKKPSDSSVDLKQRLLQLSGRIKGGFQNVWYQIHEARLYNCMTENSFRMFLILTLVSFFLALFYLTIGKRRLLGAFILSFIVYIFFLDILMASERFGLPVLIEDYRVRVFLCYALPFMIAVPVHAAVEVLEVFYGGDTVQGKAGNQRILRRASMIPVAVFAMVTLVKYDLNRYPGRTTVIQSDSVVDVFYRILEEYDDFTWTLVSDVQEYAMCLENGYHYEWTNLLQKLSTGVNSIKIPTKYVFFAIEKRPIVYGSIIENGSVVPTLGEVSREWAKEDFIYSGDSAYINQRMQIMSRAYYWAKAYAEKFPDEMKIYYEDENVIYYCLTQEPYYLNNLKIDYGYNSIYKTESEEKNKKDNSLEAEEK